VYPLNWACWDGRVPADWYKHEHPLDTETLAQASGAQGAAPAPQPPKDKPAKSC